MKVSIKWLNDFIDLSLHKDNFGEIINNLGLEIDEISHYESIIGGLNDLVVGKIIDCQKHPNADRLHVVSVDIGLNNNLNIVCGAPNVRVDLKVVVAQVNTIIYPFNASPVKIKKSKIRGVESEGMLCAEDEIGISNNHNEIIELPDIAVIGQKVSDLYNIYEDDILTIELTPNRGYAASHIGIARDLQYTLNQTIKFPEYLKIQTNVNNNVKIETDKCHRYCGLRVDNVKITDSPIWMKNRLSAVGIKPINNVVDITNYVMLELGQPMHAYDCNNISGDIIIRLSRRNEIINTLDKEQHILTDNDIVISDSSNHILGLGGIMGGLKSSIKNETTSIFFESAYFNPGTIRKSARYHDIHTEASYRFERNIDEDYLDMAIKRAVFLLKQQQSDIIFNDIVDIKNTNYIHEPKTFTLSYKEIYSIIGVSINNQQIISILKGLSMDVIEQDHDTLLINVPNFRKNIECKEDIIEDILRVYGYDNITLPQYFTRYIKESNDNKYGTYYNLDNFYRHLLKNLGLNEIYTCPLISKSYMNNQECVTLKNSVNTNLDAYRNDLIYSALESIKNNISRKLFNLRLFEIGPIVLNKGDENVNLGIYLTGNKYYDNWNHKTKPYDIYDLKSIVYCIFENSNIDVNKIVEEVYLSYKYYDKVVVLSYNNIKLGEFGIVTKLIDNITVYYANINVNNLYNIKNNKRKFDTYLSIYPTIKRDLSLILNNDVSYCNIQKVIDNMHNEYLYEYRLFDIYYNEKDSNKVFSLRFIFQDNEGTMENYKIQDIMDKIIKTCSKELGAQVRLE